MPLPALALLGIGAGINLIKHVGFDMPRAERQRKLAATTQALSPWTHLEAGTVEQPDIFKSLVNGGLTSYQIGSKLQKDADIAPKDVSGVSDTPSTVKVAGSGGSDFSQPMGPVYGPSYAQNKYPWFNVGSWPGQ